MKNLIKTAFAAALCLAASVPAGAAVAEDVIATVNGKPLMLSDYERQISPVMSQWAQNDPGALQDPAFVQKLRKSALEQMIDDEVLYQESKKQKILINPRQIDAGIDEIKQRFQVDPAGNPLPPDQAEKAFQDQLKRDGLSYSRFRQRIAKQVAIRKLIDQEVKSKIVPPPQNSVRAYFDKIKAYIVSGSTLAPKGMDDESAAAFMQIAQQVKNMTSERVHLSRILVRVAPNASDNEERRALQSAQAIRQEILTSTQSFSDIARQESEDPLSAPRGGDIGFLTRGVAPAAMEKAAFSLPVGQVSDPIQTPDGYNIIRVDAHLAASTPEFSDFKTDLSKALMNLEIQKKLEAYVESLKKKAVIERHLPS
ncbi:MAG: peptidylprolyl isomerase [Elusimicrobiota bacterium]